MANLGRHQHGRPHIGANGVSWPHPGKMDEKLKSENMQKRACLCYILRAIRAGRCRERRYADHIFIQTYFKMHHFVVKFSKFSSPQAARGHWPPNQNPADALGHHGTAKNSLFRLLYVKWIVQASWYCTLTVEMQCPYVHYAIHGVKWRHRVYGHDTTAILWV